MFCVLWEEMQFGKVYVGFELKIYVDIWVKQNYFECIYQEFIELYCSDVMFNVGLLGGICVDVMVFVYGIICFYYRIESYWFWKKEQVGVVVGDMMVFGIVVQLFVDRLVIGFLVYIVFKIDGIGKENVWWCYK